MNTKEIIDKFKMQPHPEGGWYSELWQSPKSAGNRNLTSHIYYLLEKNKTACWHRLTSDEIWLFHSGANITITMGGQGNRPTEEIKTVIGEDLFHILIPANTWQKANAPLGDTLVSCIVSPGYDQRDWEMIKES